MHRLPLKRNRSPSPDDETRSTSWRPKKKKPKLMATRNPPKPSARKQRLLRLLHRQKGVVTPLTLAVSGMSSFNTLLCCCRSCPAADDLLCISTSTSGVLAFGGETFTKSEPGSQVHHSSAEVPGTARMNNSGRLESLESDEVLSVNPWSQWDGPPAFLGNDPFDNLQGELLFSQLSTYLTGITFRSCSISESKTVI